MPYNAGPPLREDDEDQPWRPGGSAAGGQLTPMAPGSPTQGRGVGTGGSIGSVGGTGRFVNFGRMLDLNKEKASATASRVTGNLDNAARDAQQRLGAAQTAFGAQTQGGGTQWDAMRGSASTLPQAGPEGERREMTSPGQQAAVRQGYDQPFTTRPGATDGAAGTTATTRGGGAITLDETQQRALANMQRPWTREELEAGAGQTYTGPNELDTTGLEASFGGLQDRANALGQPGGLESEVARSMGLDPTQSTGASRWEAGLAGVAGAEGLGAARSRFGRFGELLSDARTASRGQAAAARDRVAGQAGQYQQALDSMDAPPPPSTEAPPPVPKSDGTFQNQLANAGVGSPGDSRALHTFARDLRATDPDVYEALVNNRLSDEQVAALVRSRRSPRGGG